MVGDSHTTNYIQSLNLSHFFGPSSLYNLNTFYNIPHLQTPTIQGRDFLKEQEVVLDH